MNPFLSIRMAVYLKLGNYYIDYYADGRRVREKVGPSLKLARQAERKRKTEIAEGKFFPDKRKPSISFAEAAELYWELHAKHKASAPVTRYHKDRLKTAFGSKRLDQISIPDILRYLNDVKASSTAATANRHHNIIRSIFYRAIEWDKFSGPNPAAKVKQFQVENSRLRFLSKEEIAELTEKCHPRLYPIIVCALMTGMRRGEILQLTWENVNLEQNMIYVLKSKSGKPREIPIASKLREVLVSLRSRLEGLVFDIPVITLRRLFETALEDARIKEFRFHDLRHTFASHYIMRTNDLPATQKLLGHHSPIMTQRYAHLSSGHLKVGMQLLDTGMDTIWTPKPAEVSDGSEKRQDLAV
ncbi:MAG: site-specific integrase [Elusimicrobia bacterium]|nr:site-specific integrase [Elusimicrobiota bacterium]